MIRNTIILNDKSSADIAGLIIQELPPITKPAQRTETEIIDGRDGDITTPLGFAAYDKEFTIGLYGDFDINAIIAFFNSEGTVVFSNEPDKYYNYQINDQIDFERLVRFRTAKVKMHVQPFKYSSTQGAETLDPPAENLLSIPDYTNTTNGVTLTVSNGIISVSGTPSAATEFYVPTGGLNVQPGSYTLTAEATGTRVASTSIRLIGSAPSNADSFGGNYLGLKNGQPVAISDTLTSSKTFNYLWFYITTGGEVDFNFTAELQDNTEQVTSDEGTFLTLDNSAEAPFNKLDLKGDSLQQIYTGKNLLNTNTMSWGYINPDGSVHTQAANTTNYLSDYIEVAQNEEYTGSISSENITDSKVQFAFFDSNKNIISRSVEQQTFYKARTVTTPAGCKFVRVWYNKNSNWSNEDIANAKLMFEAGSTATAYEPYVGGIPAPNPDYPQDVNVVTGTQTVQVRGKNLFDNSSVDIGHVWNGSSNAKRAYGYIEAVQGQTYTVSTSNTNSDLALSVVETLTVGTNSTPVKQTTLATSLTFTPQATTKYIVVLFSTGNNNVTQTTVDDANVQLELGSKATDYVPYQGQSYPLSLGSLELAKIGNYQDYIWTDGEKWYKHAEIGKVVFDGSDSRTWSLSSTGNFFITPQADALTVNTSVTGPLLCDYYEADTRSHLYNATVDFGIALGNQSGQIFIRNKNIATVEDFTTWLSAHNTTLYYALATATDEEITNETLIAQLNALSGATAYRGRTHIISTAGSSDNLPQIVAAEVMKISDGTITNAGNIYSKPTLTVYGSGDVTISLNGIQLFQIALGDTEYITIDTAAMEAYKDSPGNLQNRLVTGDYDNFVLNPGENQITFSGLVTKCIVENYSRWL